MSLVDSASPSQSSVMERKIVMMGPTNTCVMVSEGVRGWGVMQ